MKAGVGLFLTIIICIGLCSFTWAQTSYRTLLDQHVANYGEEFEIKFEAWYSEPLEYSWEEIAGLPFSEELFDSIRELDRVTSEILGLVTSSRGESDQEDYKKALEDLESGEFSGVSINLAGKFEAQLLPIVSLLTEVVSYPEYDFAVFSDALGTTDGPLLARRIVRAFAISAIHNLAEGDVSSVVAKIDLIEQLVRTNRFSTTFERILTWGLELSQYNLIEAVVTNPEYKSMLNQKEKAMIQQILDKQRVIHSIDPELQTSLEAVVIASREGTKIDPQGKTGFELSVATFSITYKDLIEQGQMLPMPIDFDYTKVDALVYYAMCYMMKYGDSKFKPDEHIERRARLSRMLSD